MIVVVTDFDGTLSQVDLGAKYVSQLFGTDESGFFDLVKEVRKNPWAFKVHDIYDGSSYTQGDELAVLACHYRLKSDEVLGMAHKINGENIFRKGAKKFLEVNPYPVIVSSAGLRDVLETVLRKYGVKFTALVGAELKTDKDGRYFAISRNNGKSMKCKNVTELLEQLGYENYKLIVIGDGVTDEGIFDCAELRGGFRIGYGKKIAGDVNYLGDDWYGVAALIYAYSLMNGEKVTEEFKSYVMAKVPYDKERYVANTELGSKVLDFMEKVGLVR